MDMRTSELFVMLLKELRCPLDSESQGSPVGGYVGTCRKQVQEKKSL
jgi:hypothetical protein